MEWLYCTIAATMLWGIYSILAAKAGQQHGGNINALLAAACSLAVSVIVLLVSKRGIADFGRITGKSLLMGIVMGSMYGSAFVIFMRGVEARPEKLSMICVITGAAPVITVLANYLLGYGEKLSGPQWVAVALMPIAIFLANCK